MRVHPSATLSMCKLPCLSRHRIGKTQRGAYPVRYSIWLGALFFKLPEFSISVCFRWHGTNSSVPSRKGVDLSPRDSRIAFLTQCKLKIFWGSRLVTIKCAQDECEVMMLEGYAEKIIYANLAEGYCMKWLVHHLPWRQDGNVTDRP